jgi:hypothetical protein
MTKLFFDAPNCQGATSALTGRTYNADRQGFIHVSDPADVKYLKQGGYLEAGSVRVRTAKYWLCDCGWESNISHCPKCDRDDLMRVEDA